MKEKVNPNLDNLGRDCIWWDNGCNYPKFEVNGRTSCEGIVDDVCLFTLNGRKPKSLSDEQIKLINITPPRSGNDFRLPPGGTEA